MKKGIENFMSIRCSAIILMNIHEEVRPGI